MAIFLNIKNYLLGSVSEMKKVIWPTRQQTINYTLLVISFSVGMIIFFGILDYIFNLGLEALIR